jgi:transposase
MITHQPYPSDVSDAEWEFVVPYLCLLREDAAQREYDLRDVFDGLRWIVRTGSPWRYLPKDFPPWEMVYQQSRRWLAAGCFEAIVHDLRAILRFVAGKDPEPTAVIFDGRTVQSTPEDGCVDEALRGDRLSPQPVGRVDGEAVLPQQAQPVAEGDPGEEARADRLEDSLTPVHLGCRLRPAGPGAWVV